MNGAVMIEQKKENTREQGERERIHSSTFLNDQA